MVHLPEVMASHSATTTAVMEAYSASAMHQDALEKAAADELAERQRVMSGERRRVERNILATPISSAAGTVMALRRGCGRCASARGWRGRQLGSVVSFQKRNLRCIVTARLPCRSLIPRVIGRVPGDQVYTARRGSARQVQHYPANHRLAELPLRAVAGRTHKLSTRLRRASSSSAPEPATWRSQISCVD